MPVRLACIGLSPALMVAPSAAGLATFLLAGLGQDTAALPYGHCLLADHFQQLTAQEERSEEHTSELQSRGHLVCRLLLEKKKKKRQYTQHQINNDKN